MNMRRFLTRFVASLAILVILVVAIVQVRYAPRIYANSSQLPHAPIAMILGASVKKDGSPSAALKDRMEKGIELYKMGVVDRLLLTGDDGAYHVDEMRVMTTYVREHGVPDTAVLVDGQGYRTYESCTRAKQTYQISRVIVVTQRFHLGRALYLCNQLGVESDGIVADRTSYDKLLIFWLREIPASLKAWWDVHGMTPKAPVSRAV